MKKLITIALFAAAAFNLKAQNNYLLTKTGEKVTIIGERLSLDVDYVSFRIENKEKKKGYEDVVYKDKKIKMFEFEGRVFMVLPDKKSNNIQEIVCFNDKYILTSWYVNGTNYHIKVFDWSFNSVSNLKPLNVGVKNQRKDLEGLVKPYFGDCTNVMDAMVKNINNESSVGAYKTGDIIIKDINAVKCNNTTKTIQDLIKNFMSLPEPTK